MKKELSSLETLLPLLRNRLQQALPGEMAHEPMRAKPLGSLLPTFNHILPPKLGSVMIMIFESEGKLHFPLIKRPEYLGAHSGQVSFPGGKIEAGESAIEAALRECEEEIGVRKEHLEVLGHLSDFFVIPSNFMVTPFVAIHWSSPEFKADQHEVERILIGSIDDLLGQQAIQEKEILAAGRFRMQAPHFQIENEIVWGATAMMLNEFRVLLKEIG